MSGSAAILVRDEDGDLRTGSALKPAWSRGRQMQETISDGGSIQSQIGGIELGESLQAGAVKQLHAAGPPI